MAKFFRALSVHGLFSRPGAHRVRRDRHGEDGPGAAGILPGGARGLTATAAAERYARLIADGTDQISGACRDGGVARVGFLAALITVLLAESCSA